jgi:hypothetical protein
LSINTAGLPLVGTTIRRGHRLARRASTLLVSIGTGLFGLIPALHITSDLVTNL